MRYLLSDQGFIFGTLMDHLCLPDSQRKELVVFVPEAQGGISVLAPRVKFSVGVEGAIGRQSAVYFVDVHVRSEKKPS